MPPVHTTWSDAHAILLEALDDRARAKCGRLDQRAIDVRARRIKVLAEDQAGQPLVNENGPIAVVPVERQKTGLTGPLLRRLGGQFRVQRRVAAQNALDPPFEYVADRRLAGLDAEEAGQDRAFDDAADARNIGDRLLGRHDRAVAGRGADHLDQRPFPHAAADRAVMHVEFSDGDRNAWPKPELRRPVGAERPGRLACVISLLIQPVSKLGQARIERRQELFVRKAAPIVGIERLVAGGADPPLDQSRVGDAGEHGRDPVGEFDPGEGGPECRWSDVQAMPELGPEPFRGIDPAALRNVLRPKLGAELGDPGRLAPTGVILPQPALGVEIVLPLRRSTPAAGFSRRPESGLTRSNRRRCR